MINNTINILDNTGCFFDYENGQFILKNNIPGFLTLKSEDENKTLSYLCKNKDQYEAGIGKVSFNNHKLVLERIKVVSSSNNNQQVDFTNNNDNYFYSFANSYNFNTAFNNLIFKNDNFTVSNTRATYYVDLNSDIEANLPEASSNENLVIEFKTTNHDKILKVKDSDNNLVLLLGPDAYCKIISDGSKWIQLVNISHDNGSLSVSGLSNSELFSTLSSDPAGNSGSLQYNNGGVFGEAPIYLGPQRKLLLGDILEENANAILPTSGNYATVFNNQNLASDFIVKGSGDKNLFFGYDGRLGINIPALARPQTSLHIVSNSCQEGIRLENRNQCYPANVTLYHKPNSIIQQNSVIGTINLSAKNSSSNQVDYVQLVAKANSYTTNATKGEFVVKLEDSNTKIEALKINSSGTFVANNLYISSLKYTSPTTSGYLLVTDNSGNVYSRSINTIPINISSLKYTQPVSSGNLLISDGNGNMILTNINNTPIIDLLDGGVVSFTGVCS